MTNVHAKVLIGENLVTLPDDKAAKRPVPLTDLKFPAAWVIEFIDFTNCNLNVTH